MLNAKCRSAHVALLNPVATRSSSVPAGDLFQLALVPVDVAVAAAHMVVVFGAAVDGAASPIKLIQTERNRNVEDLKVMFPLCQSS